ncbi:hypothetical protein SOVF_087520 [Spinacia oleracea]|nr:hypothetical protein SOVF_087520 [Spinacia oleracea]
MMKNKSAKSETQFPNLPDHLIVEQILPRLPVKSLIRFKSVSKYWLSTISSHKFAKLHLEFSSSNTRSLILQELYKSGKSYGYYLSFDECYNFKEFVKLEDKFPIFKLRNCYSTPDSTYVVDSYNGIVCMYNDQLRFYLWNPATNQCHNTYRPALGYERPDEVIGLGFGYISSLDDYRIGCVMICDKELWHVYVYSLRIGKWKETSCLNGDYYFPIDRGDFSVLVDDTLYWPPTVPRHENEKSYIVGLNLVSGKLKKTPLTVVLTGYDYAKVLGTKGYLSLCCVKYEKCSLCVYDVWMLKQHDDWNSWEKTFSINMKDTELFYSFETGKCLLSMETEDKFQIVLHDPSQVAALEQYEEGAFVWQGSKNSKFFRYFIGDAWGYVESLISPFGTTVSGE